MKVKFFIFVVLLTFVLFFFLLFTEEEVILYPNFAKDSDGSQSEEIIKNMKEKYETIILKFYPYGYIEVWGWEKQKYIKKVYAIAEWKAEEELGAGNIYIGYSFDGKNYFEIGPFNGSSEYTKTTIEIPTNLFTNIENLRIRFRGEDLDYGIDATAEVKIFLKVIKYKFRLL